MKNINEKDTQEIEPPLDEEDEIETVDPEPTMYITELMENWNTINLIERDFKNIENTETKNMNPQGEIILQTTLKNKNIIIWLANTGSPRSFIDIQTAKDLNEKETNLRIENYDRQIKFKCFNNKDISIKGQLQMKPRSGSRKATNCNVLVVDYKSQKYMGRDMLEKTGTDPHSTTNKYR